MNTDALTKSITSQPFKNFLNKHHIYKELNVNASYNKKLHLINIYKYILNSATVGPINLVNCI